MSPDSLPDVRSLLSDLSTWYPRLPLQQAAPLTGPTAECEALLYGKTGYADETLFLYGYDVGGREHCFLYDTPWDEVHRALGGGGPAEWYDGLKLPRSFRVRYSAVEPFRHEIIDPLLKQMMKRPLRRLGTRHAVPHPLTARAEEVLRDIEHWDERLFFLRRGRYLESAGEGRATGWTPATAVFGGLVGNESISYAHYRFTAGGTEYVFAVKPPPPNSRMIPEGYSPQASRKERRAHLAGARRQEQAFRSLASGQTLRVRFNPRDPGEHSLELPPLREGEAAPGIDPSTTAYQLEPVVLPSSR
jgi:hypothetical protein